jgi:hypothetical protein
MSNIQVYQSRFKELSFFPNKPSPKVMDGLSFFEKPLDCIEEFENRSCLSKVASSFMSFVTFIFYLIYKIKLIFRCIESEMRPLAHIEVSSLPKKRLIVCLHGLNNNPSQFKKLFDELQKRI